MGKKDGAQRTKGNTKPSSSARSAELLLQASSDRSDFLGNDFGSSVAPIFGLMSLNPEEEAQIPSQMKMAIRKLSKKDPTTRLKAVQEFTDLCQGNFQENKDSPSRESDSQKSENIENVKATKSQTDDSTKAAVKVVLPFWPRLYQRLAIDLDRRVREATQKAHLVIIGIVNRDIAPHLKALAPTFYLSLCDPHQPAAVLAEKSFALAFPTNEKRRNAVLFCQAEILAHIQDNLTNQNAQSLSDAKTTSPEDMESKYHRILIASLNGYAFFLGDISRVEGKSEREVMGQYLAKHADLHKALLGNAQFWKLSQHKNPSVRHAWYNVANALCQQIVGLTEADMILDPKLESKLSALILGKLDEPDPGVAAIVWEASLHLTENSNRWGESVNIEKQVFPKIVNILKEGCHKGQIAPQLIYPNILPLLSHLTKKLEAGWKPEDQDSKYAALYTNLLSALRVGLNHYLSLAPKSMQQTILLRKGGPSHGARFAVDTYFDCALFALTSLHQRPLVVAAIQNSLLEWVGTVAEGSDPNESILEAELLFQGLANFIGSIQKRIKKQKDELEGFYADLLAKLSALIRDVYNVGGSVALSRTSTILLFLMGNATPEENKDKKGGIKFSDEVSEPVGQAYMTSCFCEPAKSSVAANRVSCLPEALLKTVIEIASVSVREILTETPKYDSINHVQFLVQILSSFNASENIGEIYAQMVGKPGSQDGAIQLLRDIAGSKLLHSQESGRNACITKLCLVIAGAIDSGSKPILFETLFGNTEDQKVTDRLLSSLLQAEENVSSDKSSILSGKGFVTRLGSISRDLPAKCQEFGQGTWSLIALAFQNSSVIPAEVFNQLLAGFSGSLAQLQFEDKNSSGLVHFCHDLFIWSEKSDLAWMRDHNKGSKNFILALFKIACQTKQVLRVRMDNLWVQGVKQMARLNQDKDLTHQMLSHIRDSLLMGRTNLEIVEQACTILTLLSENNSGLDWQECWLEMLTPLPVEEKYVGSINETIFLFPQDDADRLLVFDLRSCSNESTQNCDFFINTAAHVLRGDRIVDLNPSLVEYFAISLTSKEKSNVSLKKIVCQNLSRETQQKLLEVTLKYSLNFGFERSLALDKALEWLKPESDEPIMKAVLTQLGSSSSRSETEIQTLQVLIKFLSKDQLFAVLETECGFLISLESNQVDEAYLMTASLDIINSVLHRFENEEELVTNISDFFSTFVAILDFLVTYRQVNEDSFLFSCDVAEKSWRETIFPVAVCRFMRIFTQFYIKDLWTAPIDTNHWDLILCSLSSWVQSLDESSSAIRSILGSNPSPKSLEVASLSVAVFDLSHGVAEVLAKIEAKAERSEQEKGLLEEWTEFFSEGIYSVLMSLFVDLVTNQTIQPQSEKIARARECILVSLGTSLRLMPPALVQKHTLPAKFIADDLDSPETTNFPENLVFALNHLVPMLSCDRGTFLERRTIQITSYSLLSNLMIRVIECQESSHEKEGSLQIAAAYNARAKTKTEDQQVDPEAGADEESIEEMCELPRRMTDQLNQAEPVLKSLFEMSDLPFGEPLPTIFPTDSRPYISTMSLLLTWKLVLRLIGLSSSELRPKFSEFLRRRGHVGSLMETVFHLITLQDDMQPLGSPTRINPNFGLDTSLACVLSEEEVGNELKSIAASVYFGLLRDLPVLVRSWWNSTDKRTNIFVEKFTIAKASPLLWAEEATRIGNSKNYDNMTTKVRSSVREVVATYTLDEGSMELVIKVPHNFPLGPVTVESGKKIGVTTAQWRTWMLQLTTFLQHQNGSIVDGLSVWKRNLDKRFDGVEECYICFYILHGSSHQLPKLACRTCKKKFHSACLYKWFSTSNNSTCPLCRNLF